MKPRSTPFGRKISLVLGFSLAASLLIAASNAVLLEKISPTLARSGYFLTLLPLLLGGLRIRTEFTRLDTYRGDMETRMRCLARDILYTLTAVINTKDSYTLRHCQGVARWATGLAREMGLGHDEVERIRIAGLLHDIGKIGITEILLNKPGRLTPEEYELLKEHPDLGYKILKQMNDMQDVAQMVLYHQERFDGKGYPLGLRGKDIPLGARILAVADAYDAMRTDRVYRRALTVEKAAEELRANSGKQFDPELVEIFLNVADERRATRALKTLA